MGKSCDKLQQDGFGYNWQTAPELVDEWLDPWNWLNDADKKRKELPFVHVHACTHAKAQPQAHDDVSPLDLSIKAIQHITRPDPQCN